ncbi:O-linked N-acetylglucosamine transferase [Neokomagataea thailandica NBRC 106555]|uniref:Peptide transporter n=2 Tax=Neokomagataea TaxID=1223423 RepID=A0A4Y6V2N3_9PROT|nr:MULTISPECIES: tetratricopeptide repeat protein [Neokomagataea]QDH24289.1 peptide transporter [Neokomagataea tanensis]GBR53042.1 O-linked N-acetylglucosamine transferase [Neokomagataea thailandica NBRC 106555]
MTQSNSPAPPINYSTTLTHCRDALLKNDAASALELLQTLPVTPDTLSEKAHALFLNRAYVEAARFFIEASPPFGPHAIGVFLPKAVKQGRRPELLYLIDAALKETPDDVRLFEAKATVLMELGRLKEAELQIRSSLERRPNNDNTLNTLAMILCESGRFDEAIAILKTLHQRAPDQWTPLCNLACTLTNIGRLDEAANLYREAIILAPQEAALRLNHSITMLKAGRMAQGWAEHEWRFGLPGHTSLPRERLLPNITPSLDLKGKRVLITQEEGLGDTLMYLRYLPALIRTGALVHVWGAPTLTALTERIEGISAVQSGGKTPDYDYHCPFISLPRAFSATPDAMGAPVPYLTADPAKKAYWLKAVHSDQKLKVGLVWAGGARPENSTSYMLDRKRSMPLKALNPLASLEGLSFYSLQKDSPAEQLPDFSGPITNYMPQCLDMDDTAALVSALDVIVTVDTSMVHLAGALGKPVIMMDRTTNCWRWLQDREDSPWYPAMRIVRQTRFQEWGDVVERVAQLLKRAQSEGASSISAAK